MSEPHAAIVLSQLRRLDEFIAARQHLARRYDAADRASSGCARSRSRRTRTATTTSTSRSFPTASTGHASSRRCASASTSASRVRCTTRRCTTSRCSPTSPTGRCPARSGCAPGMSVCRCIRRLTEADVDSSSSRSPSCSPTRPLPSAITANRIGVRVSGETIAVTGGSGFVGSHVVDALLGAGHEIRVIDPKPPRRADDVDWADVDMLDQDAMTDALKGVGPVFHLAAMADVNDIVADPAESVAMNTLGVARVLEAARRADAGRVIMSSTVWVYAATQGDEVDETTLFDLDTDRHLYVSEKIAAEMLCRDYSNLFGRPYTVLRYGIPFGPRMRSDLVVAAFLLRAMRGEPLRIDGDGAQERRFVYVEDLAAAHVLALKHVAENRTYNLESEEATSIRMARRDGARPRRRCRGDVRAVAAGRLPRARRTQRPRARGARVAAAPHLRRRPAQDARLVPRAAGAGDLGPDEREPAPYCGRSRVQRGTDGCGRPRRAVPARRRARRGRRRLHRQRRAPRSPRGCRPWRPPTGNAASCSSTKRTRGCRRRTPPRSRSCRARLDAGELDANDLVFTVDADGQHDLHVLDELVQMTIDEGLDANLARRDLSYHGPFKKTGNWVLSKWASLWAGAPLRDVESGYRIFRLGALAHALDYYSGYQYSETVEVAVVMCQLGYQRPQRPSRARPVSRVTHTHARRIDRSQRHPGCGDPRLAAEPSARDVGHRRRRALRDRRGAGVARGAHLRPWHRHDAHVGARRRHRVRGGRDRSGGSCPDRRSPCSGCCSRSRPRGSCRNDPTWASAIVLTALFGTGAALAAPSIRRPRPIWFAGACAVLVHRAPRRRRVASSSAWRCWQLPRPGSRRATARWACRRPTACGPSPSALHC